MEVNVLGPLEVRVDGKPVDVRSSSQRALLGLLALAGGDAVPWSSICDAIWPERPRAEARHLMQTSVSGLRRILAPDGPTSRRHMIIASQVHSYRLTAVDCRIDAVRFRRLAAQAGAAAAERLWPDTLALYEQALSHWRAPVLIDTECLEGHPALAAADRERQAATIDYAEAGLAAGAFQRVLPLIHEAVDREPLNGRLGACLMVALAGNGMQETALRHFNATRVRLAEDLGVDPDPHLLAALQRILQRRVIPDATQAPGMPTPSTNCRCSQHPT